MQHLIHQPRKLEKTHTACGIELAGLTKDEAHDVSENIDEFLGDCEGADDDQCVSCYDRALQITAKEWASDDRAWREEQAMEAGMLHGLDAYNDMMGY